MTVVTVGDLKAQFSDFLKRVQAGETIAVAYGQKKEVVAYLVPTSAIEKPEQRQLGVMEGRASYKLAGDFTMTEDELLSL